MLGATDVPTERENKIASSPSFVGTFFSVSHWRESQQ